MAERASTTRNEPLYVPDSDDEALAWLERFHRKAAVNPNAFGFDARDVASLGGQIDEFRSRLAAAAPSDPARISIARIAAAAEARAAAVRTVERLVRTLRNHPLAEEEDLRIFGITTPRP